MNRVIGVVTAVFAIAFVASPVAAKDLCISFPGSPALIVAKNFTVPARNACKPLHGFADAGMMVGTGCTRSDGAVLRLYFSELFADSDVLESWACNFVLPAMTEGNCRRLVTANTGNNVAGFTFDHFSTVSAAACMHHNVP